ncbi:ABC transporter permease [bacterium]|nr:ABC transporter permease [bacterium]
MHDLTYSFLEGIKIAQRALWANKTRTILTTLGIVIGVVTVTLMMMIIQGLNSSFQRQISFIGSGTVYVEQWPWIVMDDWWIYRNRPKLTMENFQDVKEQLELAEVVAAYTWTVRPISFKSNTIDRVGIVGVTPDYVYTGGHVPEYGRFVSELDNRSSRKVCVIGADIKRDVFDPYNPIGRHLRVGAHSYTVVGILERQGTSFGESNDNYVMIPLNTLLDNYGHHRSLSIVSKAKDSNNMDAMVDELTGILRRSRSLQPMEDNNFAINRQEALTDFYKRMTAGIYIAGLIIGGIALAVGGIGIMNIMLVSVTERTWEIGMRKAVGAKTTHILWQFLVESMLICSFGGIVGLGLAALGGAAMDKFLPTSLPLWLALLAVLFSSFVGLVFGLLPATRAARLDPITALRQD